MSIDLQTVATLVGVLLGLGAVAAGVYKYWGLPDRVGKLEDAQTKACTSTQVCQSTIAQQLTQAQTNMTSALRQEVSRVEKSLEQRITAVEATDKSSRLVIHNRLNALVDEASSDRLQNATATAALKEIQNGIRDKFQLFERLEAVIGTVLQAKAEQRAEISRLKDDYHQLQETVQKLNREMGELRVAIETREAKKRT